MGLFSLTKKDKNKFVSNGKEIQETNWYKAWMIPTHGIVFCKSKGNTKKKKNHSSLKYKIQILIINKADDRTLHFYNTFIQYVIKSIATNGEIKKFKNKNVMHKQITHLN